jgi:hypothetical protein
LSKIIEQIKNNFVRIISNANEGEIEHLRNMAFRMKKAPFLKVASHYSSASSQNKVKINCKHAP